MIKIFALFLGFNFLQGCMPTNNAALRYNYMEKEWVWTSQDATLHWNPFEKRWEYAK